MLSIDLELMSDLTFDLEPDEYKLILIKGILSSCIISTIIEAGATYSVKSSQYSTEFIEQQEATIFTTFEDIKIDGVSYSELAIDIPSLQFKAPNLLYIKNTSLGDFSIRVSLRGNRS